MESTNLLPEMIRDQATIVRLMANDFYLTTFFKQQNDAGIEYLIQQKFDLSDIILELMNLKDVKNNDEIREIYNKKIEEHVVSFLAFPSLNVNDILLDTYLELKKFDTKN